MTVSINQPAYLPWLGYFERIARSDLHVVLDHVQFEKNSFTNRNKVPTPNGTAWLTVPVVTKGQFGHLPIRDLQIDNTKPWPKKHWNTLRQIYAKAPYFKEHAGFFEETYRQRWSHLLPLTRHLTAYLLARFGITTPLVFSSELAPTSTKSQLVLDLCRHHGADTYLSGALGRDYLDLPSFEAAGIEVAFQDYRHPEYPQLPKAPFTPYLAAVDLLFRCGPDSLDILLNSKQD